MPLNLLKTYNALLDINGLSPQQRNISLKGVFNRDITNNNNFKFLDFITQKLIINLIKNTIYPFNNRGGRL